MGSRKCLHVEERKEGSRRGMLAVRTNKKLGKECGGGRRGSDNNVKMVKERAIAV
jgi:hypothetical protein